MPPDCVPCINKFCTSGSMVKMYIASGLSLIIFILFRFFIVMNFVHGNSRDNKTQVCKMKNKK